MINRSWLSAPRHLLLLFLATGALLVCTMLWLGWQLARQDRDLDAQRLQEHREHVADLSVAALRRALSQLEADAAGLTSALSSPAGGSDAASAIAAALPADSVLVTVHRGIFSAYPANRLAFYPDTAIAPPPPQEVFAEADALEFRAGNHAAAIAALARLARGNDAAVSAAALVRTAAVYRRQEQWQAALEVYRDLEHKGPVPVEGVPAELLARHARMTMEANGTGGAMAAQEAAAVGAGLSANRWRLTRGAREFYAAEAARLMSAGSSPGDDSTGLALAQMVDALGHALRAGSAETSRRLVRADNSSALALVRTAPDAAVALLIGPHWWQARLAADLGTSALGQGVGVGLTDPEGHAIISVPAAAEGPQTVRLAAATGLPWNVVAVTTDAVGTRAMSAARQQMVAVGLGAVTLLVLAGIALIARAVARELAAGRRQSEFVSAVSHEFRTPLSSLCLLSEKFDTGRVADEAERAEYYGVMARESQRLRRLVDGLLSFGRMEAGAMHYTFVTIDPIELAREVCDEFQRDAAGRGRRVELQTHDDTPLVSADRAALACALWNLLDNAVKYSPGSPAVWVEVGRDARGAVIRVRDAGIGIAAAEQGRIFDKFIRGHAAEQAGTAGTGLGLALVRHIVAAHDGTIDVESALGRGSSFTIVVPAMEEVPGV